MKTLADSKPAVSPLVLAGFLLVARRFLNKLGLPCPQGSEILAKTGVSRSRAYEIAGQIESLLPEFIRPPGRPRHEETPPRGEDAASEVSREVIRYLMEHPGAVCRGPRRHRYSDGFRLHVIGLRERFSKVDSRSFALACQIPPGTLEDWLRASSPERAEDGGFKGDFPQLDEVKDVRIQSILYAWRTWHGDFTAFCDHVREHLRLTFGNTLIASILGFFGERRPRHRRGRSRDEEATHESFETFFPGAEWIGDGKEVTIWVDDEKVTCNLEFMVDADTGAFVGTSIRESEDSHAVIEAFEGGIDTTGKGPLAVLLDNKPSNHTEDVDETLGETLRIRSTLGRPQSKAHVEGGFGLFSQTMPPLNVNTSTKRELAHQVVGIVAHIFCQLLNHKPRRDRDGKSRFELYTQDNVTEDDREKALERLNERQRKQEQARKTREARVDPTLRKLLEQTFDRLGLIDPEHHIRNSVACYPLDDIIDGVAIFEGKRNKKTLPKDADGRYLLGIIRNVHHVHESDAITNALLQERLRARDVLLMPLVTKRDDLIKNSDSQTALNAFVQKALSEERALDRRFWTHSLASLISEQTEQDRPEAFKQVARRIHATFSAPVTRRNETERRIARLVWPVS